MIVFSIVSHTNVFKDFNHWAVQEISGLIPSSATCFQRLDGSQRNKIYYTHTADHCLDNSDVNKQPVARKEYYLEFW